MPRVWRSATAKNSKFGLTHYRRPTCYTSGVKIEFLPDGSPDCPLIRMFEYQPNEVEALRTACRELADGKRTEFALHEQAWIESVGGCAFIWKAGTKDVGVRLPRPGDPFVFIFSDEGWREVEDKLLLFAPRSPGFNWLTDGGDVEVLISNDGRW